MNKTQKEYFFDKIIHAFAAPHAAIIASFYDEAMAIKPEKKIRKVKSLSLMPLESWELIQGRELNFAMLEEWAFKKRLAHAVINKLIEEFRMEMFAKGKAYADFKATFQVYLTKGYLSLTLEQAQKASQGFTTTELHNRGVNL